MRLARGFYATTINIHNPNNKEVRFYKKLALTYPPREQKAGKIMPIGIDSLKYDEALKVDCEEVKKNLFEGNFPTPYIEGYVVIQSPRSLDVDGVYTSASVNKNGHAVGPSNIDVESINERIKTLNQPDLIPFAPFPEPGITVGSLSNPRVPGVLYCVKTARIGPVRAIRVGIKNAGISESDASMTKVIFENPLDNANIIKMIPTIGLRPGEKTFLDDIPLPDVCVGTRCNFKIIVDASNHVDESIESNNTVKSTCGSDPVP